METPSRPPPIRLMLDAETTRRLREACSARPSTYPGQPLAGTAEPRLAARAALAYLFHVYADARGRGDASPGLLARLIGTAPSYRVANARDAFGGALPPLRVALGKAQTDQLRRIVAEQPEPRAPYNQALRGAVRLLLDRRAYWRTLTETVAMIDAGGWADIRKPHNG